MELELIDTPIIVVIELNQITLKMQQKHPFCMFPWFTTCLTMCDWWETGKGASELCLGMFGKACVHGCVRAQRCCSRSLAAVIARTASMRSWICCSQRKTNFGPLQADRRTVEKFNITSSWSIYTSQPFLNVEVKFIISPSFQCLTMFAPRDDSKSTIFAEWFCILIVSGSTAQIGTGTRAFKILIEKLARLAAPLSTSEEKHAADCLEVINIQSWCASNRAQYLARGSSKMFYKIMLSFVI